MARFPVLLVLLRCWPIMETARFSLQIGHTDPMVTNPKILLCLALVLGGIALSPMPASAQPGDGFTSTSLEARIIQARVVFRGTITNVSDAVIHTNNQFSREGVFANKPVENY